MSLEEKELSIVIPARFEAENLALLLPEVNRVLSGLQINYEIIVCDELADDNTKNEVLINCAVLNMPQSQGYGSALMSGFGIARGKYIITMDADLSHPGEFLEDLWNARDCGDIIIASRYIKGGRAIMPWGRLLLSRILNSFFSWGLSLPVKDMSSGYRLYRADFLKQVVCKSQNFNILQELLVNGIVQGYRIHEIPFSYKPRQHGSSHARILQFGINYLQTFLKLWINRLSNH